MADARMDPPAEQEEWLRREILAHVRADWVEVNEIVRVVFARTRIERGGIVGRLFDYRDDKMVEIRGEPLAFEVRLRPGETVDIEALEAVRDNLAFCLRSRVTGETRYGAFRREHLGAEDRIPGERIQALVDAGLAAPGDRKPFEMHAGVLVELTDAGRAELDR